MADEELSPLSSLWDEPLRSNARLPAGPLPSAAPIGHAATRPPAVHRGRLIAGFAAVLAIGLTATTASVLGSGAGIAGTAITAEMDALVHGAAALSGGGGGGPHDVGRGGGGHTDLRTDAGAQPDAGHLAGPDGRTDAEVPGDEPPFSEEEMTPDAGSQPPVPETSAPGPSTPPDASPAPSPSTPLAPQPAPHASTPPASNPPATTPPPATAAPLAFTGLTENTVAVLGLPLLSDYTLGLTGEPGARASVTYGSLPAGSVTFDGSGHATLTIGTTLLGIHLNNPVIRATYSDGTDGAAVEARRDSL